MSNNNYKEEQITFRELGKRLGIIDLNTPEVYDISNENYEILSYDILENKEIWSPLEAFVVKASTKQHYQINTLHGTKDHKIFVNGQYVRLEDYVGAELVNQSMQVVDCQVANTHNYLAEGQINHNTTTPGGMAIPYAASTRLRLSTGSPIKSGDQVVGIEVDVKTIKNKVSKPFRSCSFEIHFGKGIYEHGQIFDVLRKYCETTGGLKLDGKRISVEGTAAWKTFCVFDEKTQKNIHEVKFNRSDFDKKVLEVPEFQEYVQPLLDAVYIMSSDVDDHPTYKGA